MQSNIKKLSYKQLIAFFIPLGLSSSLTSLTHVIINSTLSRGDNAAFTIACYAVAFSIFGIVERPIIVFRQTSSVLVNDARSFKALNTVFMYVLLFILALCALISFSPIGDWLFISFFNANQSMVQTISFTFSIITLVIIFSGIRGMYQGVIISHLETRWLTVGVIVRLSVMFIVSYLFVAFDLVTSMAGAIIFLVGMFIECVISVWRGNKLLKGKNKEKPSYISKSTILRFYIPLVFYFIAQTVMIPIVYAFIAKSDQVEISIASFALAFSVCQLIVGFFMYTHQLVVQFYKNEPQKLVKFMLVISMVPSLALCILCFTPVGYWFMHSIMGAEDELAQISLSVLAFFILKTLLFPWMDFLNGFLMLQRETKKMVLSQVANISILVVSLFLLTTYLPHLNGINGALAVSLGELAGLITVALILFILKRNQRKRMLNADN